MEDFEKEIKLHKQSLFVVVILLFAMAAIFYFGANAKFKTIDDNFRIDQDYKDKNEKLWTMLFGYSVDVWLDSNNQTLNLNCPALEGGKITEISTVALTVEKEQFKMFFYSDGETRCFKNRELVKCADMCSSLLVMNATEA